MWIQRKLTTVLIFDEWCDLLFTFYVLLCIIFAKQKMFILEVNYYQRTGVYVSKASVRITRWCAQFTVRFVLKAKRNDAQISKSHCISGFRMKLKLFLFTDSFICILFLLFLQKQCECWRSYTQASCWPNQIWWRLPYTYSHICNTAGQ